MSAEEPALYTMTLSIEDIHLLYHCVCKRLETWEGSPARHPTEQELGRRFLGILGERERRSRTIRSVPSGGGRRRWPAVPRSPGQPEAPVSDGAGALQHEDAPRRTHDAALAR